MPSSSPPSRRDHTRGCVALRGEELAYTASQIRSRSTALSSATRKSLHAVAGRVSRAPGPGAGAGGCCVAPGGSGQRAGRCGWRTSYVGPDRRVPLAGRYADVTRAAASRQASPNQLLRPRRPHRRHPLSGGARPRRPALTSWFARGEEATLAPDTKPVLWPEHFDLGITVSESNSDIPQGDAGHTSPSPTSVRGHQREGPFWNASFLG